MADTVSLRGVSLREVTTAVANNLKEAEEQIINSLKESAPIQKELTEASFQRVNSNTDEV